MPQPPPCVWKCEKPSSQPTPSVEALEIEKERIGRLNLCVKSRNATRGMNDKWRRSSRTRSVIPTVAGTKAIIKFKQASNKNLRLQGIDIADIGGESRERTREGEKRSEERREKERMSGLHLPSCSLWF